MTRAPALAVVVLAAACAGAPAPGPAVAAPPPPPGRFRLEDAPGALQPAVARADAAVRTLREQIAARLWAEVAAAGISRSLAVCQRDAAAIAASVSAQTGVEVGRVGVRPRPGTAAPRPWIGALLEVSAKRAADVQPVVLDLGDRVGLLRPIALAAPCLACHGAVDRVLPEVKHVSDSAYSAFAEGDLRGFFWAEARK
jgi:Protein of unknown function (DUF3365)